jgi:hypothetical protein
MSIELYFNIGMVIGLIVGFLTFIVAYMYCIAAYGYQFGLGFGWLPSVILAAAVGWFAMVVWPLLLVILAVVASLVHPVRLRRRVHQRR